MINTGRKRKEDGNILFIFQKYLIRKTSRSDDIKQLLYQHTMDRGLKIDLEIPIRIKKWTTTKTK